MAQLDAQQKKKLLAKGQAIKNASGKPSFQIANKNDLSNAIRAVGRVRPNTEEARSRVRRYIIRRARALGASNMIPDTWSADGSLKG